MLKKILSLTLCLCICLGIVFSATSCGSRDETTESTSSKDAVPTTLSFLGVTSEITDQNNVQMVEDALNDIFSARYKTKIDLTLVTEDEYMALIEARIAEAEYWQTYDNSILQYNAYIKKQANQSGTTADKIFGNWISGGVEISLETLATRLVFLSEQTTVHEDGRVETLYPEATPIDIVMILDEEMYDEFDNIGLLVDQIDPNYTSLKTLQKYIYPTFFTELKNLKGAIKAVPNNNILAESTYLVVNKELADKYNFEINSFKGYGDLADFLKNVKENEQVAPFKDVPEALGVFKLFSEDVAVGAYFDPMIGYNPAEGINYAGFEIQNLFEIPQYVEHLALMETYTKSGYFAKEYMANGYAVQVIEGDASVMEKYSAEDSEYFVKEIQIPFVGREAIFDGMLAYTSYCDVPERALEIIEAINTDPEVKNLLQYGIYEYNYLENTNNGTVIRLNNSYMMENAYTGNVYMGLLEEGMKDTSWAYVKQTNLSSANSPFMVFPVDEKYLQDNLKGILKDAALAEALADIGMDFTTYRKAEGSNLASLNKMLKNGYKDFFFKALIEDSKATDETVSGIFEGNTVAITWYEDAISNKIIAEKYNKIQTLESIGELVDKQIGISAGLGANYSHLYWDAKADAAKYLGNIESLRVISRITLFNEMSDAEYQQKYGSLSVTALETAVYNYLRENYVKENNITDEDYRELVQNFIAEEFDFTNKNKVQYSYTWKNYEEIKEQANKFAEALDKAKAEYKDILLAEGHKEDAIEKWDDITLADNIIAAVRQSYYRSHGGREVAYIKFVQNQHILNKYGYTADEFDKLKNTDNATYKSVLAKIKKDFKKQLLEEYTKAEYEELADNKAYEAVTQYFIEQNIGARAGLCEAMGISKEEYKDLYYYMEEYIKCAKKMRTSFIYTLRAYYADGSVNVDELAYDEIENVVYTAVAEYGYYMNQVAQCIGISLSDYNSTKGDATTYLGYVDKLINANFANLKAAGYDVEVVKTYTPDKVEDIIRDIIRVKDFSDYKTIDVVFSEMCKDAIAGIDTTYTNIEGYCTQQKEKLENNYLFSALVSYLNADLQKKLDAAKPEA